MSDELWFSIFSWNKVINVRTKIVISNNVCKSSWTSELLTKNIIVDLRTRLQIFTLFWFILERDRVWIGRGSAFSQGEGNQVNGPSRMITWSLTRVRSFKLLAMLGAVPRKVEYCYFWEWFKKDWKIKMEKWQTWRKRTRLKIQSETTWYKSLIFTNVFLKSIKTFFSKLSKCQISQTSNYKKFSFSSV